MFILKRSVKRKPELQWALGDRQFFACGACHILAYAFLQRFLQADFKAVWIKPAPGHVGNHVIATDAGSPSTITASPTAGGWSLTPPARSGG